MSVIMFARYFHIIIWIFFQFLFPSLLIFAFVLLIIS